MAEISILVLAAGASSRMKDKAKQLLPWKNTTLLGHAIDQARKVSDSVTVVIGANAETIKNIIPKKVESIYNPNWESGMGSSIAAGAHHILEKNDFLDGIMIMLADQPLLDANYLHQLMVSFEKDKSKIITTSYGKKMGVPAIFPKAAFSELLQLNLDVGAKYVIENQIENCIAINPHGKEIDIDTIKDYNQLTDK